MSLDSILTHSMCNFCFETIPACRSEHDGKLYIIKVCPEHGQQIAVREPDAKFYRWLREVAFDPEVVNARPKATMINTTDRCNLACPNCYHQPGKEKDPSIEKVVEIAKQATRPTICMLGAEATVRQDLPELITAIKGTTGKRVSLYTNGLRLAKPEYTKALSDAGLFSAAISLQLPYYVGPKMFATKKTAIHNVKDSNIKLWHIAFSIEDIAKVGEALDTARSLDLPPETYFRFRVTGAIGADLGSPLALSDLVQAFHLALTERGLTGQVMKGSHPYMVIVRVEDRHFYLLRWPSVEEVDLDDLACCPARGLLVPELGELPLVQQMLIFAHRRRVRS